MDKDNKKCKECNAILKKDAIFCHKCGKKIVNIKIACTKCGAELTSDEVFCHKCGEKNDYLDNLLCSFGDKTELSKLIVNTLINSNKPMSIYEMQCSNEELYNIDVHKMCALLKRLTDNQIVKKKIIGKVVYFELIK